MTIPCVWNTHVSVEPVVKQLGDPTWPLDGTEKRRSTACGDAASCAALRSLARHAAYIRSAARAGVASPEAEDRGEGPPESWREADGPQAWSMIERATQSVGNQSEYRPGALTVCCSWSAPSPATF
jgi:hypothetical protein